VGVLWPCIPPRLDGGGKPGQDIIAHGLAHTLPGAKWE
jgi:hypothetical protein